MTNYVVKEYRKPREFWILKVPGMFPEIWGHKPDLSDHPDFKGEVFRVVEVIE